MGEVVDLKPKKTIPVELTFDEVVNIRVAILTRLDKLSHASDQEHAKKKMTELLVLMKKLYNAREKLDPTENL